MAVDDDDEIDDEVRREKEKERKLWQKQFCTISTLRYFFAFSGFGCVARVDKGVASSDEQGLAFVYRAETMRRVRCGGCEERGSRRAARRGALDLRDEIVVCGLRERKIDTMASRGVWRLAWVRSEEALHGTLLPRSSSPQSRWSVYLLLDPTVA